MNARSGILPWLRVIHINEERELLRIGEKPRMALTMARTSLAAFIPCSQSAIEHEAIAVAIGPLLPQAYDMNEALKRSGCLSPLWQLVQVLLCPSRQRNFWCPHYAETAS
jgi:hypothetical protein